LRDYCNGRLTDSPSYSQDIPADRADLVLQASWEIDSIARMTLEYLPADAETLIYRAMMRRCIRLASMVMSAIGELNIDTATLQSMFDDGEVSHG
jgi:hypothetical protein